MYAAARRRFLSRWWSILFPARWRFRSLVPAVVAGVALVLAVAVVMADHWSKEKPISMQGNVASAITTDLTAVARTRVFYGHQSVGTNVLSAVPGVYAAHGLSAPPIEHGGTQPGPNGGFIAHQLIGENGKPLLKLEDFDRTMRGGMGRQVDVALMNIDVKHRHGCRCPVRALPQHHGRAGAGLPQRHLHPRDGALVHRRVWSGPRQTTSRWSG